MGWKRKLTSRKFWMSIASFTSMLLIYFRHSESEAAQIASLIMAGGSVIAYVIGEGMADGGNAPIEIEPQVDPENDDKEV